MLAFFPFLEIGKGRLTVGKIYGGLLILENWKATKFGKMAMSESQVTYFFSRRTLLARPFAEKREGIRT